MPNQTEDIKQPPNVDHLIENAKSIYDELSLETKPEYRGKYIAIDVQSRKYFIGETRDEALKQGRKELPNALFFVRRIAGIDTVARNYPYRSFERSMHARLL